MWSICFCCGGQGVVGRLELISISTLLVKPLMWIMLDLDFPWSIGGDTMKQHEAGRCVAIYYPFKTKKNRWAGPADKVARSQSRWQKGGNPMGPGQQLKWGQENWKGGARKMGKKRKKALCERSGWSITHPSLCLLFCQTSKGPKKTWWQNTQKLQECMSRGYSLCATLN